MIAAAYHCHWFSANTSLAANWASSGGGRRRRRDIWRGIQRNVQRPVTFRQWLTYVWFDCYRLAPGTRACLLDQKNNQSFLHSVGKTVSDLCPAWAVCHVCDVSHVRAVCHVCDMCHVYTVCNVCDVYHVWAVCQLWAVCHVCHVWDVCHVCDVCKVGITNTQPA